jgi:hypothetical protein
LSQNSTAAKIPSVIQTKAKIDTAGLLGCQQARSAWGSSLVMQQNGIHASIAPLLSPSAYLAPTHGLSAGTIFTTIGSDHFNYKEESQLLVDFLWQFVHLEPKDWGINSTVHPSTLDQEAIGKLTLAKWENQHT